jgi:hypothetical protein
VAQMVSLIGPVQATGYFAKVSLIETSCLLVKEKF